MRIDDVAKAEAAWSTMGAQLGVLESFVPFRLELSVVVARTRKGEMSCFPVAENAHSRHILDVTTVPAAVPEKTQRDAVELACSVARALDLVGVLAVELFWLDDGRTEEGTLLVNELAPRPHNSGHFTLDACVTSQFEQQLRAVCGLPLGDVSLLRPVAMANLLGDLWASGEPRWDRALALPDVKLHLYGKADPRPGRKMGHMTVMAADAATARERVLQARRALVDEL